MLAIACYPFSQALELEIYSSSEFKFFKSTPDSCFVLMGTLQLCPVVRVTFFFFMLCVAKPFLNVSSSYILAGCPVITKPIWQSPMTLMVIPLFGWVCIRLCEAYPCPANAIFPQLELIQALSRESLKGAQCQSALQY